MPYLPMRMGPDGNGYVAPIPEPGPPPQPAYAPESSASYQYESAPVGPPPQPDYVATDLGYTPAPPPGPPPQPEYIPTDPGYQTIPPPPVPSTLYGGPDPNAPSYPWMKHEIENFNPSTGRTSVTLTGAAPPLSEDEVAMPRLTRKIGNNARWFDGPTVPGQPLPVLRPSAGVDPLGAVLGIGRFMANYLPGGVGGRNLVEDVANSYMPYDQMVNRYGTRQGPAYIEGQEALPDWLSWINSIYRRAWFDPVSNYDVPGLDTTDAYLGTNKEYLTSMASLPTYMQPFAPLIARGAHAITQLPGPGWQPPPLPRVAEARERGDRREGRGDPLYQEPNVYYDDPYIPGPDHGRKRSA